MAESEPSPVPDNAPQEARQRLLVSRRIAVDLLRQAEDLEEEARQVRRRARSRLKHYEDLLAEYSGQLALIDSEGGF